MQIRGLMLDSARCLENRDYYRAFIPFAAERGINVLLWHFTDDQGCTLAFESVPGIGSPHAYSKVEMRELIAFAKVHGITIVPELASLGHSRFITSLPGYRHLDEVEHVFTGMCPVAPETREVLAKLVAETCEVFDAPWFHVGLDEANIGHHPLTKRALEATTRAQVVADHINFMHGEVRRHGRTMMMWGDGLLKDRDVAPLISREIVVCDWQYAATVPGESVQYFLDEGFDVVLCPALISHGQPQFPGDQLALGNLRSILRHLDKTGSGRILGVIETIWQPERYMHDAIWIGVDLAAAMLREGPGVDVAARAGAFARAFYGFDAPPAWAEACREIYRLSPLRGEWLAVLKMDEAELPPPADVAARADAWARVAATVAGCEALVTRNERAYATFSLMLDLVAHLYRKAVALRSEAIRPAEARRLLADERRLVAAVDAVWDHERFADDPTRYVAARACFRDNNLLATLHAQLDTTAALLARRAASGIGAADPAGDRPADDTVTAGCGIGAR